MSETNDLSAPVRVVLGDGFHSFRRGTQGGTPVVIDALGRPYTADQLADFVAMLTALAQDTETRAQAGDLWSHRALPGVWDSLARAEAAAALLAPPATPATPRHQAAVVSLGPDTVCRCICGVRLQTNAAPLSPLWYALVHNFVLTHGGA